MPSCVSDRLQPHKSYINAHHFTPRCVSSTVEASVCRCDNGKETFDCTRDRRRRDAHVFRTLKTDSCLSSGFIGYRRRKRAAVEQEIVEDDDIILPENFPIPPTPNVTEFPPPPTWPTPSGITEQQARDACQRLLESYAAYNVCREFVDLEAIVTTCVLNYIQVGTRRNSALVVCFFVVVYKIHMFKRTRSLSNASLRNRPIIIKFM